MTTRIKVIIFDFGNVLIRWDPHNLFMNYFANDLEAIDSFMDEVNFFEWNHQLDKGLPYSEVLAEFSTQFPQYAHIFHAYFSEDWEKSITGVIPGTVTLLQRLYTAGYQLYGLTNWSAEKFSFVRQNYDFCKLFNGIVVSGEVKIAKPDPAIFQLLLRKIDRSAYECLFIDDSSHNIETARELGFGTIHFTTPAQLEIELGKWELL